MVDGVGSHDYTGSAHSEWHNLHGLSTKEAEMVKPLAAIAMLAGIASLAAVACGGDEEETAAAAATVRVGPSGAAATEEQITASVDLSQEGDVIDFTIIVSDEVSVSARPGIFGSRVMGVPGFVPTELTFKVGQTVNFTLQPDDPTTKHSFTAPALGINEIVKYGQAVYFTYTFDKPGLFHFFDTVDQPMTGTITVVE